MSSINIKIGIKTSLCFLLIFCYTISFSGCNRVENDTLQKPNKALTIISYCAKETTEKNQIYFHYPLFDNSIQNADIINTLIENYVAVSLQSICQGGFHGDLRQSPVNWEWNNGDYSLQAMYIQYSVVCDSSELFSIKFEGIYNNKSSINPMNYFNTLNIDMINGKPIVISDLYNINSDFIDLIQKNFNEQMLDWIDDTKANLPNAVEEIFNIYDDDSLLKTFNNLNKNVNKDIENGFFVFFEKNFLGISIPISNALGDHFEIMIAYEELAPFKKEKAQ